MVTKEGINASPVLQQPYHITAAVALVMLRGDIEAPGALPKPESRLAQGWQSGGSVGGAVRI